MSEVFFSFRPGTLAASQEDVLLHIRRWPDVQQVSRLVADASASDTYRICVVYLTHGADPDAVIKRLQRLPEIEEAEAPTPRALL